MTAAVGANANASAAGVARVQRLAFLAAFVVVTGLLVDAVVEPAFVPTNDGPHHVFGAYARAHIDEPGKDWAHYFVPNVPSTANGFAEIFALLEPSLGWQRAHAWSLAVIVVIWFLSSLALVSALEPKRRFLALLLAQSALGWTLALGFFSFVLGTALCFAAVALALKFDKPTPLQRALLAAVLLVVAAVHFLAAALAGLCVLAVRLASVEPKTARARLTELGLVVVTGLPAMLLVLRAVGATENHEDPLEVLPWSLRVEALGACTVGGPVWRQALFAAPVLVSAALLAVGFRKRRPLERALGAVAVGLCAFPLVLPWTFFGWQNAAVRPLPLAAAILVALLPVEKLQPKLQAAAALSAFLFAVTSTLWARGLFLRASNEIDDVLQATSAPVPAAGYRWPFVLTSLDAEKDAGMLRWDPQRGLGSLFALTQGGFVAHSHVISPQAHTVLLKPETAAQLTPPLLRSRFVTPIRALDDGPRAAAIDLLASHAVQVDGVIAIERPADHALWKARGYAVDLEHGRVLLAHFTGCSLIVDAPTKRDVAIAASPAAENTLKRIETVDGPTTIERVPCGAVDVAGCGQATLEPGAAATIRCN